MITKLPLQKIFKGTLHTAVDNTHSHESMGIIKFEQKDRQVIRE
jgi:hypothetical protein